MFTINDLPAHIIFDKAFVMEEILSLAHIIHGLANRSSAHHIYLHGELSFLRPSIFNWDFPQQTIRNGYIFPFTWALFFILNAFKLIIINIFKFIFITFFLIYSFAKRPLSSLD